MDKNKKKKDRFLDKRNVIQIIFALITNGYIIGFFQGKIFTGKSKFICVPGLNCYSCPGALGACPIGALQAVVGNRSKNFSYYVFGIIIFFGVVFGRFVCGFLCPFGLVQDLLYKIKFKKIKVNKKLDNVLRYFKYAFLIIFVLLLPLIIKDAIGSSKPYFCEYICPVGTLEGGIPLLLKNENLRQLIGFLFNWKLSILITIILVSIFICRPFCKYICPLGALYGLFNKYSFYQLEVDENKCTRCGLCVQNCRMNVEILKDINSKECIRCKDCINICPVNAISVKKMIKK